MKTIKEKNVRKIFLLTGVGIVFFVMLWGWRIWNVNHTKLIEKYKARTIVYKEGTDIHLSDTFYYWDMAKLDGYGMRVTNTKVMRTEAFLE